MNKEKCEFCGANINNCVEDNIRCILSCPNCLSDLKMRGDWTGVGHTIMLEMVNIYGLSYVLNTYEKIKFEEF